MCLGSNCMQVMTPAGVHYRQFCDARHYAKVYQSDLLIPVLEHKPDLVE